MNIDRQSYPYRLGMLTAAIRIAIDDLRNYRLVNGDYLRSREQIAAALADVLDRANAKEKPRRPQRRGVLGLRAHCAAKAR